MPSWGLNRAVRRRVTRRPTDSCRRPSHLVSLAPTRTLVANGSEAQKGQDCCILAACAARAPRGKLRVAARRQVGDDRTGSRRGAVARRHSTEGVGMDRLIARWTRRALTGLATVGAVAV